MNGSGEGSDEPPPTGGKFLLFLKRRWRDFRAFASAIDRSASGIIWFVLSLSAVGSLAYLGENWWLLLWGVIVLGVIVIVTREIKRKQDTVVVFRLGYAFIVLVAAGGAYLMLFYNTPFVLPHPDAAGPYEYIPSTFGVLRGCDYAEPGSVRGESVFARGPGKKRASAVDSASKTEYPAKAVAEKVAEYSAKSDADEGRWRPAAMPSQANYCGDIPPQWVLNIGGVVLQCHVNGRCVPEPAPCEDIGCRQTDIGQMTRMLSHAKGKLSKIQDRVNKAKRKLAGSIIVERVGGKTDKVDISHVRKTVLGGENAIAELEKKIQHIKRDLAAAKASQEIGNNIPGAPIVGGLVVPIYFVVVAVMGALVGMVRKLPEYQARNDQHYDGDFEALVASGRGGKAPLQDSEIPEYVVFQMLQVASAVPIGIVAYSFARPNDIAVSAILAFFAGFSSEAILVAIRSVGDRLIGSGPRGPRVNRILAKDKERRKQLADEILARPASIVLGDRTVRVGDRVTLRQEVETFAMGSPGVIVSLGPDTNMTVRVGTGPGTREVTKSAEFFEAVVEAAAPFVTLQPPAG